MALSHNPSIVTSGLVFAADAANMKSYDENLLTYSQAFTGWSLQNITATSLSNTAPDGVAGATLFTTTSSGYTPVYNQPITVVAGSTLTLSVYYKVGSSTTLALTVGNSGLTNAFAVTVNNITTTPTLVSSTAGTATYTSSSITAVGNGWYRVSVTGIIDSSTTAARIDFPIATSLPIGSSIYLWGAQLNYGNSAAPYTPTTATAVAKTLNDVSGNNNNSSSAVVTYNSSGGGSLSFNGTSSYIGYPSPVSGGFNVAGQITVEYWQYLTTNTSVVPFCKGVHYVLAIQGINTYQWADSSNYSFANFGTRTATGIGTLNTWKHITITKNASNLVSVYINGVLADSVTFGGALTTTTNPLWIGGYSDTATAPTVSIINGNISQFKVYDRALSATEVAQNFTAHRSRYGV
jgi:hypothetical protein